MGQELTLEEHIAAVAEVATELAAYDPQEQVTAEQAATLAAAVVALLRGAKQIQDQVMALKGNPMALLKMLQGGF